jgi:hypothetical protein
MIMENTMGSGEAASNQRRYVESQLSVALESDHAAGAPDQD